VDANPKWARESHDFGRKIIFLRMPNGWARATACCPSLGLAWQPTRPPVLLDLLGGRTAGREMDDGDDLEKISCDSTTTTPARANWFRGAESPPPPLPSFAVVCAGSCSTRQIPFPSLP